MKLSLTPSTVLVSVALLMLSTGSQLISSNSIQSANTNAIVQGPYGQFGAQYVPANQAGDYMAQASSSVQQHPAVATIRAPVKLVRKKPVQQKVVYERQPAQIIQQQPQIIQQQPQTILTTQAQAQAANHVISDQVPVQPVELTSMPVEQLLKQLTVSNVQSGGSNTHYNNHVSNVKIGNHETSTVNHVNNNMGTSISGSMVSNDIGHKGVNGPIQDFGTGNTNSQYLPFTGQLQQGQYKAKASPEQKEIKARLLDLAKKVTTNTPDHLHPDESIVRLNRRTGVMTPLQLDPNTAANKAKLHNALRAISSKKIPVDKLRRVLGDNANYVPIPINDHQPEQEIYDYEPLEGDEELEDDAALQAADPENVVDQVRTHLDDRINRITDLLYFRPEFLNQLLYIDDQKELTPVESEFKRMILCISDEQFCGQDLNQWVQRRQAEIMAEPETEQLEGNDVDFVDDKDYPDDLTDDDDTLSEGSQYEVQHDDSVQNAQPLFNLINDPIKVAPGDEAQRIHNQPNGQRLRQPVRGRKQQEQARVSRQQQVARQPLNQQRLIPANDHRPRGKRVQRSGQ